MLYRLYENIQEWVDFVEKGDFALGLEVWLKFLKRHGKPSFNMQEKVVLSKPFANLLEFPKPAVDNPPTILIVAPMSGHFATLLRNTVQGLMPAAHVYITDWASAHQVPLDQGTFGVEDYIDYLAEFIKFIGPEVNLLAVCQPVVQASLVSVINSPKNLVLMGGPIDVRSNQSILGKLAAATPLEWFEKNLIQEVAGNYPGVGRRVYPGFMQIASFINMNLHRHVEAYQKYYFDVLWDNEDAAQKHENFYNEYLATSDLDAPFFLETIERVFHKHCLANDTFLWHGEVVSLKKLQTPVLVVEGTNDDIAPVGQTKAIRDLAPNLKYYEYHLELDVGHYGIFSGSKYRKNIAPKVIKFCQQQH